MWACKVDPEDGNGTGNGRSDANLVKKMYIKRILPMNIITRLAQQVERWPFKPVVRGSIPLVGKELIV